MLISIGLGIFAIKFLGESVHFNTQIPVLYIPVWPFQVVLPVAFFMSALRHALFAWNPALRRKKEIGEVKE